MRYVIALVDRMQREHPDDYAALIAATGLTDAELASWDAIQSKIYLPRKEDTDLLEQFEGYFDLEPVTIEEYDKNDWPGTACGAQAIQNQRDADHQTT